MALEDAVVLARSLVQHGGGGLAAYEPARRDRVEAIVRAGARSSSAKIPGRVGRVVARDDAQRPVPLGGGGPLDGLDDGPPARAGPVSCRGTDARREATIARRAAGIPEDERVTTTPDGEHRPTPERQPSVRWPAGVLVFGASAAVLVVELVALRLVAPYLGLTLETSTLVIGVALAAIATGAWAGGRAADARRRSGPSGPCSRSPGWWSRPHPSSSAAPGRRPGRARPCSPRCSRSSCPAPCCRRCRRWSPSCGSPTSPRRARSSGGCPARHRRRDRGHRAHRLRLRRRAAGERGPRRPRGALVVAAVVVGVRVRGIRAAGCPPSSSCPLRSGPRSGRGSATPRRSTTARTSRPTGRDPPAGSSSSTACGTPTSTCRTRPTSSSSTCARWPRSPTRRCPSRCRSVSSRIASSRSRMRGQLGDGVRARTDPDPRRRAGRTSHRSSACPRRSSARARGAGRSSSRTRSTSPLASSRSMSAVVAAGRSPVAVASTPAVFGPSASQSRQRRSAGPRPSGPSDRVVVGLHAALVALEGRVPSSPTS